MTTPTMTHEHVAHQHKQILSLKEKAQKVAERGAVIAKKAVTTMEVLTGAALGGVLQGLAKNQEKGARIGFAPLDLTIGGALELAGLLNLAGKEWSPHVANFGTGFLAAWAVDKGHAIGTNKRLSGSFFRHASAPGAPAPGVPGAAAAIAAHGTASPQQVAEAVLANLQGQGR
jgi:hypothetical protein